MVFLGLAILCAFLFVPGYWAFRATGAPRLLAVSLSPAWVGLAAGGLGLIYELVGLRWNALTFAGGLVVLLAIWMAVVFLIRGRRPGGSRDDLRGETRGDLRSDQRGLLPKLSRTETWSSWLIFLVALAVPVAALLASGTLNYAAQGHDAVFHLNGAWYVRETGNANILTSMSRMYGIAYDQTSYYPAVWHALVALVPLPVSIVQATNALMVATSWIWTVSLAALARVAMRKVQYSLPLMLGFSMLFTVFPAYLLNRRLWPNALEIAMLPAVLAGLYWAWTRFPKETWRNRIQLALIAAVPVAGSTVVYPASLVALAFILIPILIFLLVKVGILLYRHLSKRGFAVSVALFVVCLGGAVLVAASSNQIVGRLSAAVTREGTAYLNKLVSLFVYWPRDGVTLLEMLGLGGIAVLALVGIGLTLWQRTGWWVLAGWTMSALLVLGTLFYIPVLSQLTLLFYSATWRLVPIQLIFALLLSVQAAAWILGLIQTATAAKGRAAWLPPTLVGVLTAYCALAPFPSRVAAETASRMPDASEDTYMYDEAELEMIESLADLIDDGKLLIGDQLSGAAMVQAISDIPVLVAHGTIDSADWVGEYLAQNFDKIGEDPLVCQLIDEYNIGYFYEDEPAIGNGRWRDQETPAYYRVDTAKAGFELVAEGGSARVWRITGCASNLDGN